MGVYSRRRSSQFNSRLGDNRGGRAKAIERKRRSLDKAWKDFLAVRSRYRHGEATLKEVKSALSRVNRMKRLLFMRPVEIDVGVFGDEYLFNLGER